MLPTVKISVDRSIKELKLQFKDVEVGVFFKGNPNI